MMVTNKKRANPYQSKQSYKKQRYQPYQQPVYKGPPARPLSGIEKKVADITPAAYQVNTTGSITLLAVPTLGSDYTNRVGRKIRITSAYIKGYVYTEASTQSAAVNSTSQAARMMLVCDLQPNGSAPAITDILTTADPSSHLNLNNRDRFLILKDKNFVFDPLYLSTTATQSYATASNQIKFLKVYKKLNMETIFNATNGGSIADITSGALYMVWIGSRAAGAADVNAVIATRVRYYDI